MGIRPPALRAGGPETDTRGGPSVLRLSYGSERVKLPRALGRRPYLASGESDEIAGTRKAAASLVRRPYLASGERVEIVGTPVSRRKYAGICAAPRS